MNQDEIFHSVRTMMVDTFEVESSRVTLEARLYEDLDLDSIDALDMVVKLQELIHRRVDEQELRSLKTIHDVVTMVATATTASQGAAT